MKQAKFQCIKSVIFLIIPLCFYSSEGFMTVIPKRANMTYWNPKYLEMATVNVRRLGRKTPYYINAEGVTKHTWADNVTVHAVFKQFLHNEYRPSFVEMHYAFCDLVNNEPFLGGTVKNVGIVCPLPPGRHKLVNMTAPTANFPYKFPFENGRVDILLVTKKDRIFELWVELAFKQKPDLN